MPDTVTALRCPQCNALFERKPGRGRPPTYCSRTCQTAARDRRRSSRIVLNGGQFRVHCGCGWTSPFGELDDVDAAHDRHLQEADSDA